jgi:hypothetical protein
LSPDAKTSDGWFLLSPESPWTPCHSRSNRTVDMSEAITSIWMNSASRSWSSDIRSNVVDGEMLFAVESLVNEGMLSRWDSWLTGTDRGTLVCKTEPGDKVFSWNNVDFRWLVSGGLLRWC